MQEYGGYLQFEQYFGSEYHENAIALNSGRNCLRYLIRARHIKKIALPKYICSAVTDVCKGEQVGIHYYDIDRNFKPVPIELSEDEYLYVVNYFGQIDADYIVGLYDQYNKHIIFDNAQAFFVDALPGVDTIYTCRKFLGVCDGAYLYTDCRTDMRLDYEYAYNRMEFLAGRFECGANAFYDSYQENEKFISMQEIKHMSHVTQNILKSLDYVRIKDVRSRNFELLAMALGDRNMLQLTIPEAPYMYPLLVNDGCVIRAKLIERKIYVPLLWPNVINEWDKNDHAYYLADNILPLPCDHRYTEEDMQYIINVVRSLVE